MVYSAIYYGTTPYHTLLSICLAKHHNTEEDHFVLAPSFPQPDALISAIRSWDDSPFSKVHPLNPTYGKSKARIWLARSRDSLQTRRLAADIKPNRVYVAKDTGAAEQSLLYHAPNDATCTYIEDGTAIYSANQFPSKPMWKRFGGKVLYGYWWTPTQVFGTSPWIDRLALTFPGQVRPELAGKPADQIPSNPLRTISTEWLDPYFAAVGVDPTTLSNLDTIVLATHSDVVDYRQNYRETLRNEIVTSDGSVAVKYHPREPTDDYLGVTNINHATILPQSVAAEFIYLLADQIETVIGTLSTALLSARWLDDDLEVISLADVIGIGDDRLKTVFRSVGVDFHS